MEEKLRLWDTTLRDGEQMPGVVFRPEQKIELAQRSSDFGSDFIELMPGISELETQTTKSIVQLGLKPEITAATMLREEAIDLAASCGMDSVILFTPLSDLHIKVKLRTTREKNLEAALGAIEYARGRGLKVHFAGEDTTRADTGYVVEFINAISKYIGYFLACDTLGCLTPQATHSLFSEICARTKASIGTHAHNDFGMATANTLAGLEAGATAFSGTFTGIGERAGNAPLEEVVASLRFLYKRELDLKYPELSEICRLVEEYSSARLQSHKPVIGANAFSHESGIHVDGILKDPATYENFSPELVGRQRRFLFGKHSGRSVLEHFFEGISREEAGMLLKKVKYISESEKRSLTLDEVVHIRKNLLG